MSYSSINKALEKEILIIENDDYLSPMEKNQAIAELEKEARDYLRNEREEHDRERYYEENFG